MGMLVGGRAVTGDAGFSLALRGAGAFVDVEELEGVFVNVKSVPVFDVEDDGEDIGGGALIAG